VTQGYWEARCKKGEANLAWRQTNRSNANNEGEKGRGLLIGPRVRQEFTTLGRKKWTKGADGRRGNERGGLCQSNTLGCDVARGGLGNHHGNQGKRETDFTARDRMVGGVASQRHELTEKCYGGMTRRETKRCEHVKLLKKKRGKGNHNVDMMRREKKRGGRE